MYRLRSQKRLQSLESVRRLQHCHVLRPRLGSMESILRPYATAIEDQIFQNRENFALPDTDRPKNQPIAAKPEVLCDAQPSPQAPTCYSPLPIPRSLLPTSYSLLPTPYSLLPIPNSQFPIPYSLFPIPYSLFPVPCSPLPVPYSLFPIPYSPLYATSANNFSRLRK